MRKCRITSYNVCYTKLLRMKIINSYQDSFKGSEWLLVGLVIAALVIIFGLVIFVILFTCRRLIRFRKNKLNQEDLLDEIADLDSQVKKLMKEKNEIMAMKVSQLGLNPNDEENTEGDDALIGNRGRSREDVESGERFNPGYGKEAGELVV